ncbi:MAG: hypothetical protein P1U40_05720 [Coxiellaceae bacterium]|nr:hypothetical protein [Coxiellaceae bacterium]
MRNITPPSAAPVLDKAAHHVALQMARRFYWFHHRPDGSHAPIKKTRFSVEEIPSSPTTTASSSESSPTYKRNKRQFRNLSASEAAYNAYLHYYSKLNQEKITVPYPNHLALASHIVSIGTNDAFMHDVLHAPSPAGNGSAYVDFKHIHELEYNAQNQAAEHAFYVYQLLLKRQQKLATIKTIDGDDKKNKIQLMTQLQRSQQAAEDLACEVRRDCIRTLHSSFQNRSPMSEDAEFRHEMEQRQFNQQLDQQSIQSAWNVGFKLSAPVAAIAALVTYGVAYAYSVVKQAHAGNDWKKQNSTHHRKGKVWAREASQAVRTFFAAAAFAFVVIPVMLIHRNTRRPSLSKDTATSRLYDMYNTVTDEKGKIEPEQKNNVIKFINAIIRSYHANPLSQSKSSKRLIALLKSDQTSLEEKLQGVVGYLTATHTTKPSRHTIRSLLWSRDEKFISADSSLAYNQGKRLHTVIETALDKADLTPQPVKAKRQVRFAPAITYRTF